MSRRSRHEHLSGSSEEHISVERQERQTSDGDGKGFLETLSEGWRTREVSDERGAFWGARRGFIVARSIEASEGE